MRSRISVNVRSWTTLTAASTVMGWCRIGLRVQMTPTELPDVDMPYLGVSHARRESPQCHPTMAGGAQEATLALASAPRKLRNVAE